MLDWMLDQDEDSEYEDDVVLNEWGTSQKNEDLELFCLCRQPEDERFAAINATTGSMENV